MGKGTGFIEFHRDPPERRSVHDRIKDYQEVYEIWPKESVEQQGARCMDCGLPFCHQACPLGNLIPDWNDLVYKGNWREALIALHATNNFPEFTGRICPAPCEASCVLSINSDPVTIEHIEKAIVDHGFENGWVVPEPPAKRTSKKVAVVGSGPSGLAAAQQLNRAGHTVTVFERDEVIGGLLALGIPDFKLEKHIVNNRVDIMEAEGIEFRTNCNVGIDITGDQLKQEFDAICLAGGSTVPRRLGIEGEDLNGVHLAMDYLTQQNRINRGEESLTHPRISAKNKRVVILGGGDTGADCLGTAHRQGAEVVYQYEILPEPPTQRTKSNPWPLWPTIFRTSSAHEEGGLRDYSILTKSFSGKDGKLNSLKGVKVEWKPGAQGARPSMVEVEGSEFDIEVDLVLLALGFLHPQREGLIEQLDVDLDDRGNVKTNTDKMTNTAGVFAAGDMSRGQSLVVWAIAEGRQAAYGIDKFLMGSTELPSVDLRGWA